jgi:hypothetical protein
MNRSGRSRSSLGNNLIILNPRCSLVANRSDIALIHRPEATDVIKERNSLGSRSRVGSTITTILRGKDAGDLTHSSPTRLIAKPGHVDPTILKPNTAGGGRSLTGEDSGKTDVATGTHNVNDGGANDGRRILIGADEITGTHNLTEIRTRALHNSHIVGEVSNLLRRLKKALNSSLPNAHNLGSEHFLTDAHGTDSSKPKVSNNGLCVKVGILLTADGTDAALTGSWIGEGIATTAAITAGVIGVKVISIHRIYRISG